VSTAATIIQSFETYELNTRLYGILSLASRLAASVKNRTNALHLAYGLHRTNRSLTEMFEKIQAAADAAAGGSLPPDPNAEPLTPQRLRQVGDNLTQLYNTLDYIVEAARRAGLFNNSLTASSLQRMNSYKERIVDLVDWCEVAAEPEHVNALFQRANEEKERGDVFNLNQVE
jgi:hypothetical protein